MFKQKGSVSVRRKRCFAVVCAVRFSGSAAFAGVDIAHSAMPRIGRSVISGWRSREKHGYKRHDLDIAGIKVARLSAEAGFS